MNSSVAKRTCPECGLDYFPKRKGQGCPHCLLRLAMPAEEETAAFTETLRLPTALKSRFFGDYELVSEIARGGMGVVYRARQLSLNRPVALKMIQADHLFSAEARLRFQVEIEAVAQLNHPHIVALYESGEYEGIHYFTMRLVEGGNLAEHLKIPSSFRQRIPLLVKICRAVHYAHQRGILHRDLKPSNILIDSEGEPHVVDFGLAKSLDEDTGFTYSSSILGSPNYMAPEQATSRTEQLSTAVDVYGLGAILYQILTGQPPFSGKTALETIRQVVDTPPISPRKINPQVDADLATICLKCLEKKTNDRYDNSEEVARDLERWLVGMPIQARPVGPLGSTWRWSKRHPAVAALSIALILCLLGLAAGAPVAAMRIRKAERAAVAHLRVSLLDQAGLMRLSGQMGMRNDGLQLVRQAAALGGPPEFLHRARDEMLATLALTDMEFAPQTPAAASDPNLNLLDPVRQRLATVIKGTNLVIRDLVQNQEQVRWSVGRSPILRVEAFSPDGACLALRHSAGISFWDTTTGRLRFATNAPLGVFAFASHAQEIFLEEKGFAISVRNVNTFQELRRIEAEPSPPAPGAWGWHVLSLAANGSMLAGARMHENTLELIDVETGTRRWQVKTDTPVTAITWPSDQNRVITVTTTGRVQFWSVDDGVLNRNIDLPSPVHSLAVDPSNALLAAAGADRVVRLWNLVSGREIFQTTCDARSLWFDEQGARLATIQRGGQVGWLDLSRSLEYQEFIITRPGTKVDRCEFNADGTVLAGGYSGLIDLRRIPDGRRLAGLPVGGLPVFAFDPLGEGIATSNFPGISYRELRETDPGVVELAPPRMIVRGRRWRALAFAGDGQRFFAANASSNAVYVFDRTLTNCITALGPHEGVDILAANRDGRRAATANSRSPITRIWDIATGGVIAQIEGGGQTAGAHFSPDDRWFVVYGDAFDLRETASWTKAPPLPFTAAKTLLGAAAFSPDGRLLAVVADQTEIHLFDLHRWESLGRLRAGPEHIVSALAFSRDGRQLGAALTRGRLQIWDLARIRQQLASANLDWDLPPFNPAPQRPSASPELYIVR